MGKIKILSEEQDLFLEKFKKDSFLSSNFYFTGGTALSLYYLQHRESMDLDFFSEKQFEPQIILTKLTQWKGKHNFSIDYLPLENIQMFTLTFPNKRTVKVDFVFYPYKRIKESMAIEGIKVDSLLDIAINKLLLSQQRFEVKDFIDLYFLLQKFTVWDLMEGVKAKFKITIDPLLVGSDFLKVEKFDYLPKMIKPLTLHGLKFFFRQKAQEIGIKSIK